MGKGKDLQLNMKRNFWKELLFVLGLTAALLFIGYIEMLMERDVTVLVFLALFCAVPVWSAFIDYWAHQKEV